MEDQETLRVVAGFSHLSNAVHNRVQKLTADGVATSGIVVSGMSVSSNQVVRVEYLSVLASANFQHALPISTPALPT